jgi:hypothetical protein
MGEKKSTKWTPLGIVAAFLALTEGVLAYAVAHVTAGVQIALAAFVILFPLLVASAFFFILWHRPWVFYSPSEYSGIDPKKFMSALRDKPAIAEQVKLARSVGDDPNNLDARFALIDSMVGEVTSQVLILMFEKGEDFPTNAHMVYEHGGIAGNGAFESFGDPSIEGTGLVKPASGGRLRTLTDEGKLFAKWLIKKGRKFDFFWSPFGGWGNPAPGGFAEKAMKDQASI